MRHARIGQLGLVPLCIVAGCMNRDLPTEAMGTGDLLYAISEANIAVEGFYFLAPMVRNPIYAGTFDPSLSPVVEICASPACTAFHARFSMTDGDGSEMVRLDEADEHYIVNWHSGRTGAASGTTYRIRVLASGMVLGYADVAVVRTGRQAVQVRADGSIELVSGQTLPVKFRLETGMVFARSWHAMGVGMNDPVLALTVFDGDVIAVGRFTAAGGVSAGYVARWDGLSWQPMGGVNAPVYAVTSFDGDLVVGGSFTFGGESAHRIARWDGATWRSIGTGMSHQVFALTVHDGDLIAGGGFVTADGETANYIARWDGTQWHSMGAGLDDPVYALAVYNGDLIAGGRFTSADGQTANRVARWDGSEWKPMGNGMDHEVLVLTIHGHDLIAGGHFTNAGGQAVNRVARWDGSEWHPMGSGMHSGVWAMTVLDGDVIAGGQTPDHVARWDGSEWQSVGTGTNDRVFALTVIDGDLIAGGNFTDAGGKPANRVARWGTP
jgi:hypothetical protein